jgi:hypothetical protein
MADVPAEGAVPSVVVPAVVAHPDIHAVLATCGFANVMDHMSIINNEGFQSIVHFGILEDKDVFEMVKRLGSHGRSCKRWSDSGKEIASSLLLGT